MYIGGNRLYLLVNSCIYTILCPCRAWWSTGKSQYVTTVITAVVQVMMKWLVISGRLTHHKKCNCIPFYAVYQGLVNPYIETNTGDTESYYLKIN